MSTRLLSMGFMRRKEAADSSQPSPATPSSERPTKRQRLSTGTAGSPATPKFAHADAVTAAIEAEELKRQQVIDRAAAEAGETKWVLSVQQQSAHTTQAPFKIVTAGYGAIDLRGAPGGTLDDNDASEDEPTQHVARTRPGLQGRRSFGKFNKVIERQTNPDLSSSEEDTDSDQDSSAEEEDDSEDDDDPASLMIREQRREAAAKLRKERKDKKKAELAELDRLAKERRKKELKLNRMSGGGISSGGQSSNSGARGHMSDVECHQCGQKGHMRKDCPQKNGRSPGQGQGHAPPQQRPWKRRSGLEYD